MAIKLSAPYTDPERLNAQRYRYRQTDDSVMPKADHTAGSCTIG